MKYICNPLNLEYKYQHHPKREYAHREAADPTVVHFKGMYYLFASMSRGFWFSTDLFDWEFYQTDNFPVYYYAPDVRQVGDYLYFTGSRKTSRCPVMRTQNPLTGEFEYVGKPFAMLDPNLFEDEDGKVYLYHGSSPKKPLLGVEMDIMTMKPKGKMTTFFRSHPEKIGWERTDSFSSCGGVSNPIFSKLAGGTTYIEGSYMTKHNGKYYLQYGAPDTAITSYGDGVYVSDAPLGPFEMQMHNPFSIVPGGFITGAGHGSTLQDIYGNWWHFSTMCVLVNSGLERRVGMFPCGFDKDGILFCNQNFADYPYSLPEAKKDPSSIKPEWMLLSYKKVGTASSSDVGYGADLALNESIKTCWRAANANPGEWYLLDMEDSYEIHAIQLNFADVKVPAKKYPRKETGGEITQKRHIDVESKLYTRYVLESSLDGKNWSVVVDKSKVETNLCHDTIILEEGILARYLKITGVEMPYQQPMAISGFRVFGQGKGKLPEKAKAVAQRVDTMDARITWGKVPHALGYNVRFGIAPDKLYSSWLIYEYNQLDLPFLNEAQSTYYVCVDAFNENGVTEGDVIMVQ